MRSIGTPCSAQNRSELFALNLRGPCGAEREVHMQANGAIVTLPGGAVAEFLQTFGTKRQLGSFRDGPFDSSTNQKSPQSGPGVAAVRRENFPNIPGHLYTGKRQFCVDFDENRTCGPISQPRSLSANNSDAKIRKDACIFDAFCNILRRFRGSGADQISTKT